MRKSYKYPKDAATVRGELENEGFKVDLRTVQRDLKELTEVFPVTAKQGKPISWRWDRNAMSFDIPGMDRTAALTLKMVAEELSRVVGPKAVAGTMMTMFLSKQKFWTLINYAGGS